MKRNILLVAAVTAVAVIVAVTAFVSTRRGDGVDMASTCPRTYENDLLTFQYTCSWMLTENINNRVLVFTNFTQRGASKIYYTIRTDADTRQRLTKCKNDKRYFGSMVVIPGVDGQDIEACQYVEHGGESLFIPSGVSENGLIEIMSDPGILEYIVPSLRMK